MGGKKKPTISQLEKRMKVLARQQEKRKRVKVKEEKKTSLPTLNVPLSTITKDVRKMRCITPYTIATRYGIKISLAKRVLRQLAEAKVIKLVDKSRRVAIYIPVAAS